jgi:hypothetical protein
MLRSLLRPLTNTRSTLPQNMPSSRLPGICAAMSPCAIKIAVRRLQVRHVWRMYASRPIVCTAVRNACVTVTDSALFAAPFYWHTVLGMQEWRLTAGIGCGQVWFVAWSIHSIDQQASTLPSTCN